LLQLSCVSSMRLKEVVGFSYSLNSQHQPRTGQATNLRMQI